MDYHYKAIVTEVYDGDTITLDIDLGFNTWLKSQKIRLWGLDTPELRGDERPEGLAVRNWLRNRILGREVVLHSIKDRKGKYGRWLGAIYLEGISINEELLRYGMAKPYPEN